ncbi:hypothetical protein IW262DRAFT_1290071 [Armillaria fumosa]|nr:hypothetical protein IW262DRAFT_1290071 [Armillaria fumosa]
MAIVLGDSMTWTCQRGEHVGQGSSSFWMYMHVHLRRSLFKEMKRFYPRRGTLYNAGLLTDGVWAHLEQGGVTVTRISSRLIETYHFWPYTLYVSPSTTPWSTPPRSDICTKRIAHTTAGNGHSHARPYDSTARRSGLGAWTTNGLHGRAQDYPTLSVYHGGLFGREILRQRLKREVIISLNNPAQVILKVYIHRTPALHA